MASLGRTPASSDMLPADVAESHPPLLMSLGLAGWSEALIK